MTKRKMAKSVAKKSKSETIAETPKRKRGRPHKINPDAKPAKPKLTLAEKQELKLKAQKAKEAEKIARGELEPKNKDRFYCTNKQLQAELIKWRDSNLKEEARRIAKGLPIDYTKRTISEELGKMIMDIGNKLLNHSSFRNYSTELKEDMRSQYFVKIIKGLKNYNFKFNNPFAFMTTAAYNSYLIVINKHYKQQNIKKDLTMKLMQELETYIGISSSSGLSKCIKAYLGNDELGND